jgi:hypothetical protein
MRAISAALVVILVVLALALAKPSAAQEEPSGISYITPFPEGDVEEWPFPRRQNGSDDVVGNGGRPGRRAHLRQCHPAGPVPQRRPEDQVGKGQVSQQLPVGDERVQPVPAGLGKVRMPPGEIGQRGHLVIIAPGQARGTRRVTLPPARVFRGQPGVGHHGRVGAPAGRS